MIATQKLFWWPPFFLKQLAYSRFILLQRLKRICSIDAIIESGSREGYYWLKNCLFTYLTKPPEKLNNVLDLFAVFSHMWGRTKATICRLFFYKILPCIERRVCVWHDFEASFSRSLQDQRMRWLAYGRLGGGKSHHYGAPYLRKYGDKEELVHVWFSQCQR